MSALENRFSDLNKQGFMKRVYAKPKPKAKKKTQEKVELKPACSDCKGGLECACWIAYQIENFGSAMEA